MTEQVVNIDFRTLIEGIKLAVIVPVFLFWSLYDLLTKTVMVKWQRTLIAFGIIYNFAYAFIDKNQINDNFTGFIVCFIITCSYSLIKRLLKLGTFGMGDVIYCAIVGLLFGTAIGILTIILSFLMFNVLFKLLRMIFKRLGSISVAFFPFITLSLFIIIFAVGETRVEWAYNYILDLAHINIKYITFF